MPRTGVGMGGDFKSLCYLIPTSHPMLTWLDRYPASFRDPVARVKTPEVHFNMKMMRW